MSHYAATANQVKSQIPMTTYPFEDFAISLLYLGVGNLSFFWYGDVQFVGVLLQSVTEFLKFCGIIGPVLENILHVYRDRRKFFIISGVKSQKCFKIYSIMGTNLSGKMARPSITSGSLIQSTKQYFHDREYVK